MSLLISKDGLVTSEEWRSPAFEADATFPRVQDRDYGRTRYRSKAISDYEAVLRFRIYADDERGATA